MKKRINKYILIISITSIVASILLSSLVFYGLFTNQMKKEIRTDADLLAKNLNLNDQQFDYLDYLHFTKSEDRITLIMTDGTVTYDSYEDAAKMENHGSRPEVIKAIESGRGESKRFSSTIHKETFYYALTLDNGNVLRISRTTNSICGVFLTVVPIIVLIVVCVFVLCLVLGSRLTKRLIEPINKINLDDGDVQVYDELAPFIRTIVHQQEQIRAHINDLEKRANTLKTITRDMKEGLVLLDENGCILSYNQSAVQFLNGDQTVEYTGKNILELTRDIHFNENVKKAVMGENCSYVLKEALSGKVIDVFFNPVVLNNVISGAVILFFDITEKASLDTMRKEFSANVSHELKTPLTSILGFSDIIVGGMAKPEDVPVFVSKIKNEVTRLISLVDDIIMISELDEGSDQNEFEDIVLVDIAKEAAVDLEPIAAEKEISITVSGDSFPLHASKNMMFELFYNLIDNAIKYNKEKGSVKVNVSQDDSGVVIQVSDTGIGIPKSHYDRIFERFYRVDKSRSKKTGGTGLGLSIVKHIALLHKGTVEVESEVDKGTVITVKI